MSATKALLSGIIDYAGLFPPAALAVTTALDNYDFYQTHPYAWMLARFVLPLHLLDEIETGDVETPRRVTLVVKGEQVELPTLPPQVESVEVAGSLAWPPTCRVFQEIDWRDDFEALIPASGGVKLRTGGLTPDTVPPPDVVVRFIHAAAQRRLDIKFTAGLHVPVPNDDPATGARMHGFLNVFAVALALYRGDTNQDALLALLTGASYPEFRFDRKHFRAGPLVFAEDEIAALRKHVVSFGSCSFLEPVEHLANHGLLQYV